MIKSATNSHCPHCHESLNNEDTFICKKCSKSFHIDCDDAIWDTHLSEEGYVCKSCQPKAEGSADDFLV